MRGNLRLTSQVNHEKVRPLERNFLTISSIISTEDSPSQESTQATEEDFQIKPQPSELPKQELQPPSQSEEKIGNLYFQLIEERTAKDKHKTAFNKLGIWHKNKIKYLGSEEFFQKISDWNSYNPKELTQNQVTIIIEQRDELIKLFTDRAITNFKKEVAVDGVYTEFLSEDSPSKEANQPTKDYTKFESHRSVLKEQELQPLSQSEEKIGNLYFQLIKERTEKDKNKTELESLEIWHKDIITYLGSNEFFNKLSNWNSFKSEELTENQETKITEQRDELIKLLTYRKIAKTQKSSDEAGPASKEDKSSKNRALVPNTSIQEGKSSQGLVSRGANNQGSRD